MVAGRRPIAEYVAPHVAVIGTVRDDGTVSDVGLSPSAGLPRQHVVAAVRRAVDGHRGGRGPLLAILNDIVAELGHVPDAAVAEVAERLNLSRAEVHGVVSFYKDLRTEPVGRCLVQVCRGEACQSVGAEDLVAEVGRRLGVPLEGTRADGAVTLEEVFCLGNCALGPAAMVDRRLYGRLTTQRLCDLVDERVSTP